MSKRVLVPIAVFAFCFSAARAAVDWFGGEDCMSCYGYFTKAPRELPTADVRTIRRVRGLQLHRDGHCDVRVLHVRVGPHRTVQH